MLMEYKLCWALDLESAGRLQSEPAVKLHLAYLLILLMILNVIVYNNFCQFKII